MLWQEICPSRKSRLATSGAFCLRGSDCLTIAHLKRKSIASSTRTRAGRRYASASLVLNLSVSGARDADSLLQQPSAIMLRPIVVTEISFSEVRSSAYARPAMMAKASRSTCMAIAMRLDLTVGQLIQGTQQDKGRGR